MTLDEYRQKVRALAQRRDGEPIYNGSLEHAGVIVENMFAHADEQVSILTGTLNARLYGTSEVIEQADIFLTGSDTNLRILIESDRDQLRDHRFLEGLSKHTDKDDIKIKRVPDDRQGLYDFHFLVMDDDSYRFEGDKTKHSAIAAFGDQEGGRNLKEIFDHLWEESEPVEINDLLAHA